jgi:hypothetical protein
MIITSQLLIIRLQGGRTLDYKIPLGWNNYLRRGGPPLRYSVEPGSNLAFATISILAFSDQPPASHHALVNPSHRFNIKTETPGSFSKLFSNAPSTQEAQ